MKIPASSPGSLITAVVATPFFTTGASGGHRRVGVHRKVRVHSCDDIISSDCGELREPQLRGIATSGLFRVEY